MEKLTEEQIKKGLDEAYLKSGHNAYFGSGFKAGVTFAETLLNNRLDVFQESNKGLTTVNTTYFGRIKELKSKVDDLKEENKQLQSKLEIAINSCWIEDNDK